jgi:threonylcarbamoyladenosine tRNA methylthiotransferase MtaB
MRIYLNTIGCRLNQSEIERYARQFRAAGHSLVESPEQADLVLVNTCAVTSKAVSDSRKKIRQVSRHGSAQIVATGCWSTLNPEQVVNLPNVSHVIHNQKKDNLVYDVLDIDPKHLDIAILERQPIPGVRKRTRAFIKVQDGCDNRCTFCVTTIARGPGHSRSIPEILGDVRAALGGDSKEIVLTGVHLGSWGQDSSSELQLRDLVQIILRETDVPRLRLSSLEPWDLNEEFFDIWRDDRLCRHLHLPLQSGAENTLRRMARKSTPDSFAKLISSARTKIPDMAITTDVIVGFPGESELDFQNSLAFIKDMNFAGGHVFTYSSRPGTAAAGMQDQIPYFERKQRNAVVRSVLANSAYTYRERFLDHELSTLWEKAEEIGPGDWKLSGLTDNYLRVTARASQFLWNEITSIQVTRITDNGLHGLIKLQ